MADQNPFGEFEDDFKNTEKAGPASTPGRVPPETYKFVLTSQEITKRDSSEQVLADHEIFVTPSGTKGFKLFCEILEPESVPNPKTDEAHVTKGQILEHVFWVTKKNLPYVMRDLSIILERDLESMGEVASIPWAGRTFEGVVQDDTYQGRVRSKIAYINPWVPPQEEGEKKAEDPKKGAADPKKDAKKPDPKATAGGAKSTAGAPKGGKSSDF